VGVLDEKNQANDRGGAEKLNKKDRGGKDQEGILRTDLGTAFGRKLGKKNVLLNSRGTFLKGQRAGGYRGKAAVTTKTERGGKKEMLPRAKESE